nr:hypothetical protein Iba_chr09aCG5690 [Ipomoea batatas]
MVSSRRRRQCVNSRAVTAVRLGSSSGEHNAVVAMKLPARQAITNWAVGVALDEASHEDGLALGVGGDQRTSLLNKGVGGGAPSTHSKLWKWLLDCGLSGLLEMIGFGMIKCGVWRTSEELLKVFSMTGNLLIPLLKIFLKFIRLLHLQFGIHLRKAGLSAM